MPDLIRSKNTLLILNLTSTCTDNFRHDPRNKHNQRRSKRQRSWKVSGGALSSPAGVLGSGALLRKLLGSKQHLDWLKTDLNAAKIITVQDYKRTKNQCEWKETYESKIKCTHTRAHKRKRVQKCDKSQMKLLTTCLCYLIACV